MVSYELQERMRETVQIPTLPATVAKIRQVLSDPEAGTAELAEVVAEDPPIAAQVVRLANSAIYAPREYITSVQLATAVLGQSVIESLVLQAAVIQRFKHLEGLLDFDVESLWRHSILTGHVAQRILEKSRSRPMLSPSGAYTCGLLHDLGKFALIDSLGEEYVRVLASARREYRPSYLSERQALGFTHAELGSMIAYVWGFPDQIADAIECHHHPRIRVRFKPHVLVVTLADQIAGFVESGRDPRQHRPDTTLFGLLDITGREAAGVLEHATTILGSIEI